MKPEPIIDKRRLLTSPAAAKSLDISERLLWGYVAAGHLRRVRVGKRGVRFTPADLDDFTEWLRDGGESKSASPESA